MSFTLRSLATVFCGWLVAQGAIAETSVMPVKTGLWQCNSESEINGKKVDLRERLAEFPPEKRAKMLAMVKELGAAMDPDGGFKICYTQQTLESFMPPGEATACKTEFVSLSSTVWRWHSECTQPAVWITDGEIVFDSPESYRIARQSTVQRGGKSKTINTILKARWLGSDCGDVKPAELPTTKPQ